MALVLESIIIQNNKETLRRLRDRGMFSDDPQWLFNAHMVLASARDVVFRRDRHYDIFKIEDFLSKEDIPYIRTLNKKD
jgi:hypothetical protein